MKKLIVLALMSASVAAQAGIISDTPTGWFVSADQKNGITFGDGDFSKKQSFTIYQGEILVGGKCGKDGYKLSNIYLPVGM